MSFELPEEQSHQLDPIRESLEKVNFDWKIPPEKLEALVGENQNLKEMLEDVFDQCLRYTKTVVEEQELLLTEGHGEDHAERDKLRSLTHTATQDTLRAFARNLIKSGKTAANIYPLMPNTESRAACGQFALRLTLSREVSGVQV